MEKIAELIRQGFEIIIQATQEFNVLCVTKKGRCGFSESDWHIPITGKATVKHILAKRGDINIALTLVSFYGKDYEFSDVRNGMNGRALVIAIHNRDERPYKRWDLYTDTPSALPDRPDEVVTSEDIREEARETISRKRKRGVC